jgi:hypothetical protein
LSRAVTVGFGDLSPKSVESQMMMAFIIICSWFVASLSLAKLIALVRINDKYNAALRWQDEEAHHVVVSGAITHDSLEHVLRELLTSNKGRAGLRVVVVLPTAPSIDVEQLGRDPRFVVNLQLVVGSLLLKKDLERVRMRNAAACFLLADKYAVDSAVDTALILQSISIVDYAPSLRYSLYVQVLRHDAKRHLIAAGIPNVLSVDELKFGVIGQSCVAPGFSTIINNMLRAYTPKTAVKLTRPSGAILALARRVRAELRRAAVLGLARALCRSPVRPRADRALSRARRHRVCDRDDRERSPPHRAQARGEPCGRRRRRRLLYRREQSCGLTHDTVQTMLEQHRNAFETETSSYERERVHLGEFDSAARHRFKCAVVAPLQRRQSLGAARPLGRREPQQ